MLAVLGFVTILLVLALIMSKKVSTLVALIFVPAITGHVHRKTRQQSALLVLTYGNSSVIH